MVEGIYFLTHKFTTALKHRQASNYTHDKRISKYFYIIPEICLRTPKSTFVDHK